MRTGKIRAVSALAVMVAAAFASVGCGSFGTVDTHREVPASETSSTVTQTTTEPTEATTVPEDKRVHVVAAGDNLIHYSVYKNAEQYAGGYGYDFKPIYKNVKNIIEGADLAILNQETIISESNEVRGANGGALLFNSPPEVADAVIDLGFDVFTMANNHLLDYGVQGLTESINFWRAREQESNITTLGAYLNEEDSNKIRVREVNGVKIAFLAYAEHLNGFSIPSDSPLRVVMNHEEDVIERQIKEASQIADAVIVSAHWGVEDTIIVSDDRKELARKMVDWGADVILGCHTHTAETMEWIQREDGTKGFVYYSMGNFVCAQTDNFNLVGELADFDIVIDGETNELTLENVGAIPTIVHYDDGNFSNMRLYSYSQYTPELAAGHGVPYAIPQGTYRDFGWDVVNRIISDAIPEEFRKLDK